MQDWEISLDAAVEGRDPSSWRTRCGIITATRRDFSVGFGCRQPSDHTDGDSGDAGAVLSFIALVGRIRIPLPRWTEILPPYAIGTIAMFWVIERTLSRF